MGEDPTFRVKTDEQTGQVVISGMGELHLEIIVDRLKREFGVEASVGKPQVAYKETITKKVTGVRGKHQKQSGGRGQFGDCTIDIEPFDGIDHTTGKPMDADALKKVNWNAEDKFAFENKIFGGSIPVDAASLHTPPTVPQSKKISARIGATSGDRSALL